MARSNYVFTAESGSDGHPVKVADRISDTVVDAFIEARRAKFFSRTLEIKDGSLKTGFGSGWGTYDGTLFKYGN